MPKKKQIPTVSVARECDCWLDIGRCYCDLESKHTRFTVRNNKNEVVGRWEKLNDALTQGRNDFGANFFIYDELEDRKVIEYEG